MDTTGLAALASLGAAFGGAIAGEVLSYSMKLRRKRIDFLFDHVDELHKFTSESLETLNNDSKLVNQLTPQEKMLSTSRMYLIISNIREKLLLKPEIISKHKNLKKYNKDKRGVYYIKRRYFLNPKKAARVMKTINNILVIKKQKAYD